MVSSISSQLLTGLGAQAAAYNGKTVIAVPPANVIYAHFKHVYGTAAPEGVNGVPISKLKILDTMIERLRQMREERINFNALPETNDAQKQMDMLIERIKKSLDANNASAVPYKRAEALPEGAFLSLTV